MTDNHSTFITPRATEKSLQDMLDGTIYEINKRLRETPESFSNTALLSILKVLGYLMVGRTQETTAITKETTEKLAAVAKGGGTQAAPLNRAQRRALEKRK